MVVTHYLLCMCLQMFEGQQQTFTQSLLGSGQQNFQQVNTQLAMAQQQQQQNEYELQVRHECACKLLTLVCMYLLQTWRNTQTFTAPKIVLFLK